MIRKFLSLPKDFILFICAVSLFSFSQSIVDSTLNNFLKESFHLTDFRRSFLELPRELPGFLVVFVSALLSFFGSRRVASIAFLLMSAGILLTGLFSINFNVMLLWLFTFSIGAHLFLPLNSSIGMELAREGQTGKRLGQLSGAGNLFAIAGSLFIFLGFRFFNFNFKYSFIFAAIGFASVSVILFFMTPGHPTPVKKKFILRKEYGLYYWLVILFGTRKQIFLTFAPWVIVSIYKQNTAMIATLLTIGGIIGIVFKPLLGKLIDRFGEKTVLSLEALVLIVVCFFYGFSQFLFTPAIAIFVVFGCYITDNLLMSVTMARATYLKKIALHPEEVPLTLTMGTSIDHIFSISIALASGLIWMTLGYQFVFLLAAFIAVINFISAMQIRIPPALGAGNSLETTISK